MNILENAAYLLGGDPFMVNTRMLKESVWDNSYDRDAPKWILDHWECVFPDVDKPSDPAEAKRMAKEKVAKLNETFNHPMDYTLGCPNERERDAEGNEIGPRVYEMKIIRMFCLGIVRILYGELNYETAFVNPRKLEDFTKCLVVALVADRKAQINARGGAVTYPWSMNLNDKSFNELKAELLPQFPEARATLDDWGNTWRANNPNAHRGAVERQEAAVELERASDGTIDDGIPQPDMSDPITIGGYKAKWIQNHMQSACWNKYTNKVNDHDGCNWCITIPHTNSHWTSYMDRYNYPTVYFLWKDNFKQLKREDFNVEPYASQQPYTEWGKSLMCLMVRNENGRWTFKQLTSRYNHYRGDGRGGFQSESQGYGDAFARDLNQACDIIGCTPQELERACPVHPRPENWEDTATDLQQDRSVFGHNSEYDSESARASRTAVDQTISTTNLSMYGIRSKYSGWTKKIGTDGSVLMVINPSDTYGRRIFLNGFPVTTEWYRSVEVLNDNTDNVKNLFLKVRYRNSKYNIIDINGFKYLPRDVDQIDSTAYPYVVIVRSGSKVNMFDIRTRKFKYKNSLNNGTTYIRNGAGFYTVDSEPSSTIHAPTGEVVFNKPCYDYDNITSNSIFAYRETEDSPCNVIDLVDPDTSIATWNGSLSDVCYRRVSFSPILMIGVPNADNHNHRDYYAYNEMTHKTVSVTTNIVWSLTSSVDLNNYSYREKVMPMVTKEEAGRFKLHFISWVTGRELNSVEFEANSEDDFGYDADGLFKFRYYSNTTRKYMYFDRFGNALPELQANNNYAQNIVTNKNEAICYNADEIYLLRNGEKVWTLPNTAGGSAERSINTVKLNGKIYYLRFTNSSCDQLRFIKEDGTLGDAIIPFVNSEYSNIGYMGNDIAIVATSKTRTTLIDLTTFERLIDRDILAILTPFDENGVAKVKLDRLGTRFINVDGDIATTVEQLTESAKRKRVSKPMLAERKSKPSALDYAAFLIG